MISEDKKPAEEEISDDEQVEMIDNEIESMFEDEEQTTLNAMKSESSDSFDEALDEIAASSDPETSEYEGEPDELDRETEEDDDSIFEALSDSKPATEESQNDDTLDSIEDIGLKSIEKNKTELDDFDSVSMEDSSVMESQSFDDELDEIGKSEFIIDRSEYLTDEDIMRIKEEGTFKSGVQLSDLPTEQEESFTENEVNELFSTKDSQSVGKDEDEIDKKKIEKTPDEPEEDITDWIDD